MESTRDAIRAEKNGAIKFAGYHNLTSTSKEREEAKRYRWMMAPIDPPQDGKHLCYELLRPDVGGSRMYCGRNGDEVIETLRVELQTDFEEGAEQSHLLLRPCRLTDQEIDAMNEFEGW